jgi:hypothetical protein
MTENVYFQHMPMNLAISEVVLVRIELDVRILNQFE